MAYLPPHKRHSNDSSKPTPVPSSPTAQFKQTLTLGGANPNSRRRQDRQSSSSSSYHGGRIIYAINSISRWWPAGSDGGDMIPSSFRLEPFFCEMYKQKRRDAKPLILSSGGGGGGEVEDRPWVSISDRVMPDLIASVRSALKDLESEGEEIKLSFVARLGKVLFFGNSVSLESIRKDATAETDSRNQVYKSFYTNVPSAHMENIQHMVVPKIGFDFDSEKEFYHVKVLDKCRPDSTITCKCMVVKDGELKIHKIELSRVRYLVVDISCLYKDLDLRLILITKRIMKTVNDEENDGINKLIRSAVIDQDVKGGLRWPLGAVSDRFSIDEAWHAKYKAFKSQTMRLNLRHADRFDHRTSTGEVTSEVTFKLTGISKHLRDGDLEEGSLREMVQESVKLIWDHFSSNNRPST